MSNPFEDYYRPRTIADWMAGRPEFMQDDASDHIDPALQAKYDAQQRARAQAAIDAKYAEPAEVLLARAVLRIISDRRCGFDNPYSVKHEIVWQATREVADYRYMQWSEADPDFVLEVWGWAENLFEKLANRA